MSFRSRMVGAVAALTIVTLGGAFVTVSLAVNRSQERQLDHALVAEAREEAREAAALGGAELAISDRPGPAANDVGPLTKYGVIYGPDGRLLASTPSLHGREPALTQLLRPPGECFDLWFGGEHLRGVLAEVPAHQGLLLLAAPRTDLDGDEAFLQRAMLIVFAAAVAWAIAVAHWLVRRLTRDHALIAAVARRVADGDLAARVETRSGDPETEQLARDINDMIERLAALLISQNEFIAHAAHELRSPLAALYGELSLALRKAREPASYRASIEEALDSARRLKALAEDLLLLARIGAAADQPRQRVSVSGTLAAAVRSVGQEAADRSVELRQAGTCPDVVGRGSELERLFRNLLENAIRHSPRQSEVTILLDAQAGAVTVTIADQGEGVRPEERERIFEPFYRGSRAQADDPPGAGLGLAIARRIARAHGGDIHLAEDQGVGAAFVVTLPE